MSPTFISLDLELNQPSGRIIQVGVCVGNCEQPEDEYVVKNWLIDPNEPISEFIVGLTGITDEDIKLKSVSCKQMAQELETLIATHQTFINPVTWGGGDSTDLLAAFLKHDIEFKQFGRRWIDVKTIHGMLMLSRKKNPSGGLRSAMGKYGLHFKGQPHRADVDAFNTLRLFFKLLKRQAAFESITEIAKNC